MKTTDTSRIRYPLTLDQARTAADATVKQMALARTGDGVELGTQCAGLIASHQTAPFQQIVSTAVLSAIDHVPGEYQKMAVLRAALSTVAVTTGGPIGATLADAAQSTMFGTKFLSAAEQSGVGTAYATVMADSSDDDQEKTAARNVLTELGKVDDSASQVRMLGEFFSRYATAPAPVEAATSPVAPEASYRVTPQGTLEMVEQPPAPASPPAEKARFFWQHAEKAQPATHDPLVAMMSDPSVTIRKWTNLGTGVNSSFHVWLSNGMEGVWKPMKGETHRKLRTNIERGHQNQREVAAYVVDKYMNHFGGVQPVIMREFSGKKGALGLWVGDGSLASSSGRATTLLNSTNSTAYLRMAVLDNVLGNLDRHTGNWMVDPKNEAVPIDHGLSFPLKNSQHRRLGGARKVNYNFKAQCPLTQEAKDSLQHLLDHRAEATQELSGLLHPDAIDAMFERVETMLAKGRTYQGWRSA